MEETYERLRKNRDHLLQQYKSNLEDIFSLQDTLIQDILPSVTDELELYPEAVEWATDWLCDTSSIFRISRRNKFTKSFSLEAIRKTMIWRLNNMWPLEPLSPMSNLHCLPAYDPFGRPILVIRVVPLDEDTESQKRLIIKAFEQLRIYLKVLCDGTKDMREPTLQYVALLDLRQLSLQSINLDLFNWTIREVIPMFPGMVAGAFIMNYSWAHSGIWSIFKRLLPETALSRVFFLSNEDLLKFFTPLALPQDYGGALPSLANLEDLAHPEQRPREASTLFLSEDRTTVASTPSTVPLSWLSATSVLNPFFGYPVLTSSSNRRSLSPPHSRRRKRDLARTLAILFWMRWQIHIMIGICLTVIVFVARVIVRRGVVPFPKGIARWYMLLTKRRLGSK